MDTYSDFAGIPAIDASILNDEPSVERKKLLQLLVASLSTYGAIRITGHGVSACKIQRAFESSKEFFSLPKQLKLSAAGSSSEAGLYRGYMVKKAHTGPEHTSTAYDYESFTAGPCYDRQVPTPWPIGVRGDTFKMMMQAFHRECASLHHDLLQVIEEALGLWDDELVSRWSHRNGEVRTKQRTSSPKGQVEELMTGLSERRGSHPMLKLVFQETRGGEIVIVCGSRIRTWIQNQLLSSSGSKRRLQAEERVYLRPVKYSLDFVGYEDMHSINEVKI